MALTTLDPITALIVVDLQSGLLGSPFIHPIGDVVARACALAMTDIRPEAHDYSLANVFPRLGETGSTQSIIELLEGTHVHELA
ncbi:MULTISPECIES: hypothetical protein [unclassified Bradyrhizobium]|uniref:hypothetical protein n=1 Tax=unclassified Bradyrhizobium TaxID=2631580 RepID=UPI00247947CC|nr:MULTISPECIES: hypothetical protein [unclassified Bradyrhizobium]WGS20430.1 hypothetical protein MTX22_00865 [Bradyrhizobium sp. ISRA463]WGS27311.1 hypothetical protein MTX19_37745 [Bradyrhizobium sp. ISRA464]